MGRQQDRGRGQLDRRPARGRRLGDRRGLGARAVSFGGEPDGCRGRRDGPRPDRGQDQAHLRQPGQDPLHRRETPRLPDRVRQRRRRPARPRFIEAEGRGGRGAAQGGEHAAAEVVHRGGRLREGRRRAGGVRGDGHLGAGPGADGDRQVEGRRQSLRRSGRRPPEEGRRLQQGRRPLQRPAREVRPHVAAAAPFADVRGPRQEADAGRAGHPRRRPQAAEHRR